MSECDPRLPGSRRNGPTRYSRIEAAIDQPARQRCLEKAAVVQANSALAARYQEIWGEWLSLSQQATRERIEAAGRVAFAGTPQRALEAQITMVRREMELFLERNNRIVQLSATATLDARQRIAQPAERRAAK